MTISNSNSCLFETRRDWWAGHTYAQETGTE